MEVLAVMKASTVINTSSTRRKKHETPRLQVSETEYTGIDTFYPLTPMQIV